MWTHKEIGAVDDAIEESLITAVSSMLTFEELHSAFVLLCGGAAAKGSEIAAAASSWITLL